MDRVEWFSTFHNFRKLALALHCEFGKVFLFFLIRRDLEIIFLSENFKNTLLLLQRTIAKKKIWNTFLFLGLQNRQIGFCPG